MSAATPQRGHGPAAATPRTPRASPRTAAQKIEDALAELKTKHDLTLADLLYIAFTDKSCNSLGKRVDALLSGKTRRSFGEIMVVAWDRTQNVARLSNDSTGDTYHPGMWLWRRRGAFLT